MKIENQEQCLCVSDIPELSVMNSADFREQINAAMPPSPLAIEIDLSETRFMDSSGLGALFALYRASGRTAGITLRLLNPRPEIEQLLEQTRMHQLYEVLRR